MRLLQEHQQQTCFCVERSWGKGLQIDLLAIVPKPLSMRELQTEMIVLSSKAFPRQQRKQS